MNAIAQKAAARIVSIEGRLTAKAQREANRERDHAIFLDVPSLSWCLRDAAEDRAERRLIIPGAKPETGRSRWSGLYPDEQRPLLLVEWDELVHWTRHMGRDTGLKFWIEDAVRLGRWYTDEPAERVWRMWQFSYQSCLRSREHMLKGEPEWAAVNGWRAGMGSTESWEFEWRLVAELPVKWPDVYLRKESDQ